MSAGNWNGIIGYDTSHLTIQGNRIGTDITGSYAIPNNTGMVIGHAGATDVLVAGNLISGNTGSGVSVAETEGPVRIEGNLIGTNAGGTYAIGNGDGENVRAASGVTVGGATTAARNIISGNTFNGVKTYVSNPLMVQHNQASASAAWTLPVITRPTRVLSESAISGSF